MKIGKDTSQITANRYKLTKLRLQEFLKAEYNLSDIPVFELTPVFVEKFFLFLRNTHNCRNNTALKFIQRFRAVFYYIKNTGADIKINSFGSFKFRTTKVVREILTQDELDVIYKKEFLTERLGQVRDIFIFMLFTGLSYIDIVNLTDKDIKEAFDGNLWIMTKRQKTNVDSNIRLLDIPKAILEKYKGKQKNGQCLPVVSNQKMNEYLKEIATVCGIKKTITCHVGRHVYFLNMLICSKLIYASEMIGNDLETSLVLRYA